MVKGTQVWVQVQVLPTTQRRKIFEKVTFRSKDSSTELFSTCPNNGVTPARRYVPKLLVQ